MNDNRQITSDDYIKHFPFPTPRERQSHVLRQIATGFASGCKYIVVEASATDGKIDKRFRGFVYRTYKFEACREMKSDGIMVKGE